MNVPNNTMSLIIANEEKLYILLFFYAKSQGISVVDSFESIGILEMSQRRMKSASTKSATQYLWDAQ